MDTQQKPLGERVLDEIANLRTDLTEVRTFADLLGARQGEEPSYLEATAAFHRELLAGLAEAITLLHGLHARTAQPEIDQAIRRLAAVQATEA